MAEVAFTDLVEFRARWTDSPTTQRRNQEVLKGFFAFCVKSDFIVKNPAAGLDPIREGRPKTEPFTREEMERIFSAVSLLADEYGRHGLPITAQTRAFVMVMRYTGMSIGDTAKLRKSDIDGCRIRTYRKKTGEDVFAKVPPFVIEALDTAPHDSDEYYFWIGQGKLHTRTSKWGNRLQRLFVTAGVRMVEVEKRKRSGGKLKAEPEVVSVSKATRKRVPLDSSIWTASANTWSNPARLILNWLAGQRIHPSRRRVGPAGRRSTIVWRGVPYETCRAISGVASNLRANFRFWLRYGQTFATTVPVPK